MLLDFYYLLNSQKDIKMSFLFEFQVVFMTLLSVFPLLYKGLCFGMNVD